MFEFLRYLWFVWLVPAPIMGYFFIRFIQNYSKYKNTNLNPVPNSDNYIIFQICSKNAPPIVHRVMARIRNVCRELSFQNYRIDLLVDNLPDEEFDANIVLVPEEYIPPNGCKYKARALQYAMEQRKFRGEINEKVWVFLLDEESFVTAQTVISLLKYVSNSNSPPISEGPIAYTNKFFGRHIFCSFGECMRPYICYDCVTQMTGGKGPLHMHGSNLLVRSDIEAKVGWDYKGVEASEDQRFGWEATNFLGGKAFGWHGGMLEEQPPLRIKDYIKQRRRWFVGNVKNVRYSNAPLTRKIIVCLRWLIWGFGFLAGSVSFFALLIPQVVPDFLKLPLLANTFLWIIGFQIGLRHNIATYRLSKLKQLLLHLLLLALTPFVGLLETYGAFTAPLELRNFVRVPTPKSFE